MANFILQFNRNSSSFPTKTAALAKLKEVLSTAQPAEPKVAIYTDGENERVLFGIAALTSGKYQIFEGAKLDSSGNISVPEEVQNAIDNAINGVQGDTDSTIKDVENVIAAMDFTGATDGSVITQVTQVDGKVSATAANLTSEDKTVNVSGLDLAVNIDGTTIVKDSSTGKISVASKALTMEGEDAIEVEDDETGKTIKLNIASTDKVLSQSEEGLLANLELKYTKKTDTANGKIELIGKNNTVISTFDTADFTVDGFLDSVAWKGDGSNVLVFTWNTDAGKTATEIDLTKYIDTYLAGNGLNLDSATKTFSVKKDDDSEAYLSVSKDGVKVSGIDSAISTATSALETKLQGGATNSTFKKVEDRIAALEGKVGEDDVEDQIQEVIDGLNNTDTAEDGQYVTKVDTEKGIAKPARRALLSSDANNALSLGSNDKGLFLSTTLDCGTY